MKIEKLSVRNKLIIFLVMFMILLSIPVLFTKASKKIDYKLLEKESLSISSILENNSFFSKWKENDEVLDMPIRRDLSKYKNKKVIAFTFDDGPKAATTNLLLDGLDKYDAKVTFFIAGTRVSSNKEVIKKAYLAGHDIGSHTYSHKNLFQLKNKNIQEEISKTNESIKSIIGVSPIYLRPPYGNVNKRINSLTDMYIICWDVDSLDWRYKNRNKIKDNIVKNAHDGAIVLLHDIYEESVMGAFLAMEELEKEGYAFVTISEMVELKGVNLDYDSVYYQF